MNKTDLINSMSEISGLTKKDSGVALDAFLQSIEKGVKESGKVQIVGFGTFEKRERAARTGRNPQTGEPIEIAASTSVGFKVGKKLRDALN